MLIRPTIDCVVHPWPGASEDIREFMPARWDEQPIPMIGRYFYPPSIREWTPVGDDDARPATSSPELLAESWDSAVGTDGAILVPLTRGLIPEPDLGPAVCRATNEWLAAKWLDHPSLRDRVAGAVRIDPEDAAAAVAELDRVAGDSRFATVAVPLQGREPYGCRRYLPVWKKAAELGFTVTVVADGGCGINQFPTMAGYCDHYVEYNSLLPWTAAMVHLASFVGGGVFERIPDLRVVFLDGGADVVFPFMWRMDKPWRGVRNQVPWIEKHPTEYLADHVRFCVQRAEGAARPVPSLTSLAAELTVYGSRFPHWDAITPGEASAGLAPEAAEKLLRGAPDFFGGRFARWAGQLPARSGLSVS
jgi:predicted TIM-barrel fold metal-dependent hydrolase